MAVSALLSYLVTAGYLAGNPLALRRRTGAAARRTPRVERYLDHALWDHVLASVEQWSRVTATDIYLHAEDDQRHSETVQEIDDNIATAVRASTTGN